MRPWLSLTIAAGASAAILGMAAAWSLGGQTSYTVAPFSRPASSPDTEFVPLGYCDRMGCTSYQIP